MNFNVRSFNANISKFESFLDTINANFSFICLTETWNNRETVGLCTLDGYNGFHTFRPIIRGGGVSLFVLKVFQAEKISSLSLCNEIIETCGVKINIDGKILTILSVYRSPSTNIENFIEALTVLFGDPLISSSDIFILTGDLNINLLSNRSIVDNLCATLNSFNLISAITVPTRFPSNDSSSPTILDHVWVSFLDEYTSGVIKIDLTDHCPTFLYFQQGNNNINDKRKITFRFEPQNSIDLMMQKICSVDWDSVILGDVNQDCNTFISILNEIYCQSCPLKTKYVSCERTNKPWITSRLKYLIKKKSEYFNLYKLGVISLNSNNRYRNYVNSEIKSAKENYYSRLFVFHRNNVRKKWNLINNLMCRSSKKSQIKSLLFENTLHTDSESLANCLNNYFVNIARKLESELPNMTLNHSNFLPAPLPQSFYLFKATRAEILKLISELKLTRTDLYTMPVRYFKLFSDLLVYPLCKIVNSSFSNGIFPNCLKIARVIPIYKNGNAEDPTNYRPIATLPYLSKLFERAIHNRIVNFSDKHSLITNCQYGFRKNLSTLEPLVELSETICSSLDDKKFHANAFIDLKKAFDTINHQILFSKLECYGIRGQPLKFIRDFLTNRFQYVEVNSCKSECKEIKCGVPQGSILGPLLFLFYINDIVNVTKNSQVLLFADDTVLSCSDSDYCNLVESINNDLHEVSKWTLSNRLTINVEKTSVLLVSKRGFDPDSECFRMNNYSLNICLQYKYLGIFIDKNLTFNSHIGYIVGKISRLTGIFYKIRRFLPLEARINFYYSFIYPYLVYCVTIWGSTSQSHLKSLITQQKRFIRLISDVGFTHPTAKIFRTLGVLKFIDVYKFSVCVLMYKQFKTGKFTCPHSVNVRNRYQAYPKFHRLGLTQRAFSFSGPTTWNGLPLNIKRSKSLGVFKNALKEYFISLYDSDLVSIFS